MFRAELERRPLDRATLTAFAQMVEGPVADVGCGPGRVTAFLDALSVAVHGVDLSPEMVALGRRTFPHLRFLEGTMTALDVPDSALGGILAWYSIIHTPPDLLPGTFAEFHRGLASGGQLLLAFQVGAEPLHIAEPFGKPVTLDFHRFAPHHVSELLEQAGFTVIAELVRAADGHERTPQAHLLVRKPS